MVSFNEPIQNAPKIKKLPEGYSHFISVKKGFRFIDKSLFIKEVIDNDEKLVRLILRPRRFGKSLNMSMLEAFFSQDTKDEAAELFQDLKIWQQGEQYQQEQGQYPVIFISFSNTKGNNYENAYANIKQLVADLYSKFDELKNSQLLKEEEKAVYKQFIEKTTDEALTAKALAKLIVFLGKHHKKQVVLLIDEYDTLIHDSYEKNYYEKMVNFMCIFLGSALKSNPTDNCEPYLKCVVMTGILQVAQTGMFSGTNNVKTYSVLSSIFNEYFGFTEAEVSNLLADSHHSVTIEEMRNAYGGYRIGNKMLYNPYSTVSFINQPPSSNPRFESTWNNTSQIDHTSLIYQMLKEPDESLQKDIRLLIENKSLTKIIEEKIVLGNFYPVTNNSKDAIWSLLLLSGYLTTSFEEEEDLVIRKLVIPNKEIYKFFKDECIKWYATDREWRFINQNQIIIEKFRKNYQENPDETRLLLAADNFIRLGVLKESIDVLLILLENSESKIRQEAIKRLIEIKQLSHPLVISFYLNKLESSELVFRQEALQQLSKLAVMDLNKMESYLIKCLESRQDDIREFGWNELSSLGLIDSDNVIKFLLMNLRNNDEIIRKSVFIRIKLYKNHPQIFKKIVNQLVDNLKIDSPQIIIFSIKCLYKLESLEGEFAEISKEITRLVTHSNHDVRQICIEKIKNLIQKEHINVMPILIEAVKFNNQNILPDIREQIRRSGWGILSSIKYKINEDIINLFNEIIDQVNEEIKKTAIHAIMDIIGVESFNEEQKARLINKQFQYLHLEDRATQDMAFKLLVTFKLQNLWEVVVVMLDQLSDAKKTKVRLKAARQFELLIRILKEQGMKLTDKLEKNYKKNILELFCNIVNNENEMPDLQIIIINSLQNLIEEENLFEIISIYFDIIKQNNSQILIQQSIICLNFIFERFSSVLNLPNKHEQFFKIQLALVSLVNNMKAVFLKEWIKTIIQFEKNCRFSIENKEYIIRQICSWLVSLDKPKREIKLILSKKMRNIIFWATDSNILTKLLSEAVLNSLDEFSDKVVSRNLIVIAGLLIKHGAVSCEDDKDKLRHKLLGRLEDKEVDVKIRKKIIQVFEDIQYIMNDNVISILIENLLHSDLKSRQLSIQTLANILEKLQYDFDEHFSKKETLIFSLINSLSDNNQIIRMTAIKILTDLQKGEMPACLLNNEVINTCIQNLESNNDIEVRKISLAILSNLYHPSENVVKSVNRYITDSSIEIARAVKSILDKWEFLKRFLKQLKKYYIDKSRFIQVAGMENNIFEIDTHYFPLSLSYKHKEKQKILKESKFLKNFPGKEKQSKKLFIWGRKGTGKSTLCQRLVYQWANNASIWGNDKFSLIIWLPLYELANYLINYTGNNSYSAIIASFVLNQLNMIDNQINGSLFELKRILDINKKMILFILDDEMKPVISNPLYLEILEKFLLNQTYQLIISNPNYDLAKRINNDYCEIEITGFHKKSVKTYIDSCFFLYVNKINEENVNLAENKRKLQIVIKNNLLLQKNCQIPIFVDILCKFVNENFGNFVRLDNLTLTRIYINFINYILDNSIKYYQEELVDVFKDSAKDLSIQDIKDNCLFILGQLGFKQLTNSHSHSPFSKENVDNVVKKIYTDEQQLLFIEKLLCHSGLLYMICEQQIEDNFLYSINLNYHEYLIAFYLAKCFMTQTNIITANGPMSVIKLLNQHIQNPIYQHICLFIAGLLDSEKDKSYQEEFFNQLYSAISVLDFQLFIKCLNEISLNDNLMAEHLLKKANEWMQRLWMQQFYETNPYPWQKILQKLIISIYMGQESIIKLMHDFFNHIIKRNSYPEKIFLKSILEKIDELPISMAESILGSLYTQNNNLRDSRDKNIRQLEKLINRRTKRKEYVNLIIQQDLISKKLSIDSKKKSLPKPPTERFKYVKVGIKKIELSEGKTKYEIIFLNEINEETILILCWSKYGAPLSEKKGSLLRIDQNDYHIYYDYIGLNCIFKLNNKLKISELKIRSCNENNVDLSIKTEEIVNIFDYLNLTNLYINANKIIIGKVDEKNYADKIINIENKLELFAEEEIDINGRISLNFSSVTFSTKKLILRKNSLLENKIDFPLLFIENNSLVHNVCIGTDECILEENTSISINNLSLKASKYFINNGIIYGINISFELSGGEREHINTGIIWGFNRISIKGHSALKNNGILGCEGILFIELNSVENDLLFICHTAEFIIKKFINSRIMVSADISIPDCKNLESDKKILNKENAFLMALNNIISTSNSEWENIGFLCALRNIHIECFIFENKSINGFKEPFYIYDTLSFLANKVKKIELLERFKVKWPVVPNKIMMFIDNLFDGKWLINFEISNEELDKICAHYLKAEIKLSDNITEKTQAVMKVLYKNILGNNLIKDGGYCVAGKKLYINCKGYICNSQKIITGSNIELKGNKLKNQENGLIKIALFQHADIYGFFKQQMGIFLEFHDVELMGEIDSYLLLSAIIHNDFNMNSGSIYLGIGSIAASKMLIKGKFEIKGLDLSSYENEDLILSAKRAIIIFGHVNSLNSIKFIGENVVFEKNSILKSVGNLIVDCSSRLHIFTNADCDVKGFVAVHASDILIDGKFTASSDIALFSINNVCFKKNSHIKSNNILTKSDKFYCLGHVSAKNNICIYSKKLTWLGSGICDVFHEVTEANDYPMLEAENIYLCGRVVANIACNLNYKDRYYIYSFIELSLHLKDYRNLIRSSIISIATFANSITDEEITRTVEYFCMIANNDYFLTESFRYNFINLFKFSKNILEKLPAPLTWLPKPKIECNNLLWPRLKESSAFIKISKFLNIPKDDIVLNYLISIFLNPNQNIRMIAAIKKLASALLKKSKVDGNDIFDAIDEVFPDSWHDKAKQFIASVDASLTIIGNWIDSLLSQDTLKFVNNILNWTFYGLASTCYYLLHPKQWINLLVVYSKVSIRYIRENNFIEDVIASMSFQNVMYSLGRLKIFAYRIYTLNISVGKKPIFYVIRLYNVSKQSIRDLLIKLGGKIELKNVTGLPSNDKNDNEKIISLSIDDEKPLKKYMQANNHNIYLIDRDDSATSNAEGLRKRRNYRKPNLEEVAEALHDIRSYQDRNLSNKKKSSKVAELTIQHSSIFGKSLSKSIRESSDKSIELIQQKSYEEYEINLAALESQRTIKSIQIEHVIKYCRIIPAKPDGDCGFTAMRLYLQLMGYHELARKINRASFINLVNQLFLQKGTNDPNINTMLQGIFDVDGAKDIKEWTMKFQKSSYWMQVEHFSLLSRYYNLRFNFYYLKDDDNSFHPELSHESLYFGYSMDFINIYLAHVTTQLRIENTPLNHFEGILIEPTVEQEQIIDEMLESPNEEMDSIVQRIHRNVSFGKQ